VVKRAARLAGARNKEGSLQLRDCGAGLHEAASRPVYQPRSRPLRGRMAGRWRKKPGSGTRLWQSSTQAHKLVSWPAQHRAASSSQSHSGPSKSSRPSNSSPQGGPDERRGASVTAGVLGGELNVSTPGQCDGTFFAHARRLRAKAEVRSFRLLCAIDSGKDCLSLTGMRLSSTRRPLSAAFLFRAAMRTGQGFRTRQGPLAGGRPAETGTAAPGPG
jgi:hypothetical protein